MESATENKPLTCKSFGLCKEQGWNGVVRAHRMFGDKYGQGKPQMLQAKQTVTWVVNTVGLVLERLGN